MKTNLIYFSPTETSEKICKSIAKGIGFDTEIFDITPYGSDVDTLISDGISVFAFPVYAGRVPLIVAERMKNIKSDGSAAVAVVLYGNRDYDDALVELKDMLNDAGFKVIAGAAFIGEHSYSSSKTPVAKNRPDEEDIKKASDFGKAVLEKFESGNTETPEMKGNYPYKERMGFKDVTPLTHKHKCALCGSCIKICPTKAISFEKGQIVSTADKCIMCCACIKKCPNNARYIGAEPLLERIDMLHKNCQTRKEPETFL